MLIYNEDYLLGEWLGMQLGIASFVPPYTCIGVMRADHLVAVVLYNQLELPNVQVTFASTTPRWATRQVIGRLLAYPFHELGCLRVSAVTRAMNQPTRAFLSRLGFNQEGFHPQLYPDDDGISYGLLKQDALKWIEGFNEQGIIERAAAREPVPSLGRADDIEH